MVIERTELAQDLPPKQIHLVRTTYQAISEKGVHRVSLQEIAERAGVSKGVILYYFKSKDQLLLDTMQWALSRTAERIDAAIAMVSDPVDRLLAMIDVIFSDADANHRFYLVYLDLLEHAARVSQFGALNDTFRSIVNSMYAEVISGGAAVSQFRVAGVESASMAIRAIIDGHFLQWLQEGNWKGTHARYREACKQAILTYLGVVVPGNGHNKKGD